MKRRVACGRGVLFAANVTLEVSQAAFLFEVGSARFTVLPRLQHEMDRGAQGRKRTRLLAKAAVQQSTGTRLLQRLLPAGTPDLRLILPGSGLL